MTGRRERDEVVLSVADNGIGIAPDMLPRIFDSFVQDRQALDRARGGLGLGLTIVKSLVSLHDGSVTAESAGRGHGASFTVRLPFDGAASSDKAERSAANPSCGGHAVLRNAFWSSTTTRTPPRCSHRASSAYGHDVRVTAPDGPTALEPH